MQYGCVCGGVCVMCGGGMSIKIGHFGCNLAWNFVMAPLDLKKIYAQRISVYKEINLALNFLFIIYIFILSTLLFKNGKLHAFFIFLT